MVMVSENVRIGVLILSKGLKSWRMCSEVISMKREIVRKILGWVEEFFG